MDEKGGQGEMRLGGLGLDEMKLGGMKLAYGRSEVTWTCRIGEDTWSGYGTYESWEMARETLTVKLMCKDAGKKLSSRFACIHDMDMLLFFCRETKEGKERMVSRAEVRRWGVGEEQLRKTALLHMCFAFPVQICTLSGGAVMLHAMGTRQGACAMFYPGVLTGMTSRMGGDFLLVPCSVREVLLLPEDGRFRVRELAIFLREVNARILQAEEILSRHIYRYDCERKSLKIVGGYAL